jgi:predicted MFS family arabinose efflux permease
MAFLLAGAPYHYGDATIGLFGLGGAAGAICARFAGRWADRGLTKATTLAFAACLAISFLPLWYGRRDLTMLIIGILILDVRRIPPRRCQACAAPIWLTRSLKARRTGGPVAGGWPRRAPSRG